VSLHLYECHLACQEFYHKQVNANSFEDKGAKTDENSNDIHGDKKLIHGKMWVWRWDKPCGVGNDQNDFHHCLALFLETNLATGHLAIKQQKGEPQDRYFNEVGTSVSLSPTI
jgi:hypothetical protein